VEHSLTIEQENRTAIELAQFPLSNLTFSCPIQVVIGCVDQNPLVGGKGVERLREEGIEVLVGVEGYACEELNLPFFYRTKYKRPYQMLR
jgi:hypothetical protein